jgi:hypothetical protein
MYFSDFLQCLYSFVKAQQKLMTLKKKSRPNFFAIQKQKAVVHLKDSKISYRDVTNYSNYLSDYFYYHKIPSLWIEFISQRINSSYEEQTLKDMETLILQWIKNEYPNPKMNHVSSSSIRSYMEYQRQQIKSRSKHTQEKELS